MSIIMALLHRNQPLHRCKEFKTTQAIEKAFGPHFGASLSEREYRKVAQRVVNALTQTAVAQQVAKEWETFPHRLKLDIMDIGNGGQHKSGNVAKGFAYLDQLMGGKLKRARDDEFSERALRVRDGRLVSERRTINVAAARAQALYGNTQRPANYNSLSKREKKRVDRELSQTRKEMKQR